jgi:hypothetical protein
LLHSLLIFAVQLPLLLLHSLLTFAVQLPLLLLHSFLQVGIADKIRPDAAQAISALRGMNVEVQTVGSSTRTMFIRRGVRASWKRASWKRASWKRASWKRASWKRAKIGF